MSYASEHLVTCARREDLGCAASIPGSMHDQIRAQRAGWFFSRKEGRVYCPDHVPGWVSAWRAQQAQRRVSG